MFSIMDHAEGQPSQGPNRMPGDDQRRVDSEADQYMRWTTEQRKEFDSMTPAAQSALIRLALQLAEERESRQNKQ